MMVSEYELFIVFHVSLPPIQTPVIASTTNNNTFLSTPPTIRSTSGGALANISISANQQSQGGGDAALLSAVGITVPPVRTPLVLDISKQ